MSFHFKCMNCGGETEIDSRGAEKCPYCGSKEYFSDSELAQFNNMRWNVLQYVRHMADEESEKADTAFLPGNGRSVSYDAADGKTVNIEYYFYTEDDGVEIYSALESVVLIFGAGQKHKAETMKRNLSLIRYPSADIKNLSRFFPAIMAELDLADGGRLIAVSKPENAFPLYSFGNIRKEHCAWIISRLENLCCVLEFSSIRHNGINLSSVYINPRMHDAYLLGGWWKAGDASGRMNTDLIDLRKTAKKVLGSYYDSVETEYKNFLTGFPAADAFADFAVWDKVLEKVFGGHKFVKFST